MIIVINPVVFKKSKFTGCLIGFFLIHAGILRYDNGNVLGGHPLFLQ